MKGGASVSRQAFERAMGYLKAGEPALALDICQGALKATPGEGNLRCLMAVALLRQHKAREAENILRELLEEIPDFARAHEELGNALLMQARPGEAVASLQESVRRNPKVARAWLSLGRILADLGRTTASEQALQQAFALQPGKKQLTLATEHQRAGRYLQAESSCREVLKIAPTDVDALRLLGSIAMQRGQYHEAIVALQDAVDLAPDFTQAWYELGQALTELREYGDAWKCLERARDMDPESPEVWLTQGQYAVQRGQYAQAMEAFRTGLRIRPGHSGCQVSLGDALKALGRKREAIKIYRRCRNTSPKFWPVYWRLASMEGYQFSDPELATMQHSAAGAALASESVSLCFALGKALEDRGDYDDAFQYFTDGNRLQRQAVVYDPVQTQTDHDRITAVYNEALYAAPLPRPRPDKAPIVVVGLPFSGMTRVEQVLSRHSQVNGPHDLGTLCHVVRQWTKQLAGKRSFPEALCALPDSERAELGKQFFESACVNGSGDPLFIDRLHDQFANLGLIRLILPEAQIIDVRRHPLDTCLGSFKHLFSKAHAFSYDLQEVGDHYLEYRRMMTHWQRVLPGRVLEVHHDNMITDTDIEIGRLLHFCGLLPEPAGWQHGDQTPLPGDFEPQAKESDRSTSGALDIWRNYEMHLGPLIEVLEPALTGLSAGEQPGST